jgi:uncharacterized damage-inducible protein DinB
VGIPQRRHREKLLQENEAVIARVRARLSGVSPDRLARRPASGGWSVAEVLEHLIVSADSYLTTMRPLIREQRGGPVDGNAVWTPTIMGGLLASSLRNPRKLPAPRSYKPGPTPRSGAPAEFLRRQEEVGRLIADAGTMDWRRVKMRSPVAPILRMNLGDALTILVVHAERHAGQIERVLSEVENQ